jgi:anti-sigma B factor antagonist
VNTEADVTVSTSTEHGAARVIIGGEMDAESAPMIRQALCEAVLAPGGRVVIDLSDVTFVDSNGIGVLVAAARAAKAVTIVGARRSVRRVLDIAGMSQVITIDDI